MASRSLWLFLGTVVLGALAGCGARPPAPADPDKARTALRAGLDAWKAGGTCETLQQQTPPIWFRDEDWSSGWKLLSHRFTLDDESFGSQRKFYVHLALKSPQGRLAAKEVQYLVDTTPNVVVVRVPVE
ncbi:MAG: hypothetical protein NZO58_01670 [Gemmataceae bacterium]|nr:hypothetical protein [Gemmataceae bacterium]